MSFKSNFDEVWLIAAKMAVNGKIYVCVPGVRKDALKQFRRLYSSSKFSDMVKKWGYLTDFQVF